MDPAIETIFAELEERFPGVLPAAKEIDLQEDESAGEKESNEEKLEEYKHQTNLKRRRIRSLKGPDAVNRSLDSDNITVETTPDDSSLSDGQSGYNDSDHVTVNASDLARTELALTSLRGKVQEQVDFLVCEKRQMREEKDVVLACLQEVLLIQNKQAVSVQDRLKSLQDHLEQDDGSGLNEMQVRLKLMQESLEELLADQEQQKNAAELESDRFRSDMQKLADSLPGVAMPSEDEGPIEHIAGSMVDNFAIVRQMENVIGFVEAQIKSADEGVKQEETAEKMRFLQSKVGEAKSNYLKEKETTCACLTEMLVMLKKEADMLRNRLTTLKEEIVISLAVEVKKKKESAAGPKQESPNGPGMVQSIIGLVNRVTSAEKNQVIKSGVVDDKWGIKDMEAKLNLVDAAIKDLEEKLATVKNQIPLCRGLVHEPSNGGAGASAFECLEEIDLNRSTADIHKLRIVISFVGAQIQAASALARVSPAAKDMAIQVEDERYADLRNLFLEEKAGSYACLLEVITRSERETQLVRMKFNKYKENVKDKEGSGAVEMETRLKMVESALAGFREECTQNYESIQDAEDEDEEAKEKLLGPTRMKQLFTLITQQRNVVNFLQAQLEGVDQQEEEEKQRQRNFAKYRVEKQLADKEAEFKQSIERLLEEKESAFACLLDVLARQEMEARMVRAKFDKFKESAGENGNGVEEMQTRLKMAESALASLREEIGGKMEKVGDAEDTEVELAMEPSRIKAHFTNLTQLRNVMNFIQAQLQAVEDREVEDEQRKEKSAKAKLARELGVSEDTVKEVVQRFLQEKESSLVCLLDVISRQEQETQKVVAHFERFKKSAGEKAPGVEEMGARIKMVESALSNLRTECNENYTKIQKGKNEGCEDPANDDLVKPSRVKAHFTHLGQLRNTINFIKNQLQSVDDREEHRVKAEAAAAKARLEKALEKERADMSKTRENFAQEKENSYAFLIEVIVRQERETQLVRAKFNAFKERNSGEKSGVSEMETRLTMAENSLKDLRETCIESRDAVEDELESSTEIMEPSKMKHYFTQVTQVRQVMNFIGAQLQAIDEKEAEENRRKAAAAKRKLEQQLADQTAATEAARGLFLTEKQKSSACLLDVVAQQEVEAELIQTRFNAYKEQVGEDGSGVSEMTTRLNMVINVLKDLRGECTSDIEKIEEQQDVGQVTDSESEIMKPSEITDRFTLLGQLKKTLAFIDAQLKSVDERKEEEKKRVAAAVRARLERELAQERATLAETRLEFANEQRGSFAVVLEVIDRQTKETQTVRDHFDAFKKKNSNENSGVVEMETRLKMVENSLMQMTSECKETLKAIPTEDNMPAGDFVMRASQMNTHFTNLGKLRSVVNFIQAQVEVVEKEEEAERLQIAARSRANLEREVEEGRAALKTTNELLYSEKAGSMACLMEMIHRQEQEAKALLGDLESQKRQSDLDDQEISIPELTSQVDMVLLSLKEIFDECSDGRAKALAGDGESTLTPSRVEDHFSTLGKSRTAVIFVKTQLQDAIQKRNDEEKRKGASETAEMIEKLMSSENALTEMREQFVNEKKASASSLLEVIARQEKETQLVRSQFEVIKKKHGSASKAMQDMENKLETADKIFKELRVDCKKAFDKDNLMKPSQIAEHFAKINQLRGTLNFIQAQLQAVTRAETEQAKAQVASSTSELQMELVSKEAAYNELQELLVDEKQKACTALEEAIRRQENEIEEARTKLNAFKEKGFSADDIEGELTAAEITIAECKAHCSEMSDKLNGESTEDDLLAPSEITEYFNRVNELRATVTFVNTQLHLESQKILEEQVAAETSKKVVLSEKLQQAKVLVEATQANVAAEKQMTVSCLMEVVSSQEKELSGVQSELELFKKQHSEEDVSIILDMEEKLADVALGLENVKSEAQSSDSAEIKGLFAQVNDHRSSVKSIHSQILAARQKDAKEEEKKREAAAKEEFKQELRLVESSMKEMLVAQNQEYEKLQSKVSGLAEVGENASKMAVVFAGVLTLFMILLFVMRMFFDQSSGAASGAASGTGFEGKQWFF